MGWEDIDCRLVVNERSGVGGRYIVYSESRYSGGDAVFNTDDPDELEAWVLERIEQKDA